MKEYIEQLGCLMILAAFIQMLAGEKYRRDTGFIMGLILLAAVCSPLKGKTADKANFEISLEPVNTDTYSTMRERIIENGIKQSLEDEIKKRTGARYVSAVLDESGGVSEIRLYGADAEAAETAAQLCGIDIDKIKTEEKNAGF